MHLFLTWNSYLQPQESVLFCSQFHFGRDGIRRLPTKFLDRNYAFYLRLSTTNYYYVLRTDQQASPKFYRVPTSTRGYEHQRFGSPQKAHHIGKFNIWYYQVQATSNQESTNSSHPTTTNIPTTTLSTLAT